MPLRPHPFSSATSLQHGFADGLAAILEKHPGLGVYILVLANAAYDQSLWARLSPALETRHAELVAAITTTLRCGQKLADPDDDVLVFLKLNTIGFECLSTMESRRAGPWEVRFNPIRALRPPRISGMTFDRLLRPFGATGFHFNKAFLVRETLWEGELAGKPARFLYNKFPFARLHGLLVPEPLREAPQYLSPELHRWAWDVCAQSAVPGLCLGYNSYGAGASVNHLHFQSFVQTSPLPLEDARFVHNGGSEPYPLPCQGFTDPQAAWSKLDQLHQSNTPYNLVYRKNRLHLVARVPQDSPQLSDPIRGYGWSEIAGVVTVFSREAFAAVNARTLESQLAAFAP